MIKASCHCGALQMQIAEAPMQVTSCNCSICRRLGALWAYYKPSEVTLSPPVGATRPYIWGDRMMAFHHCGTCGCLTHWQSLDGTSQRMAINARLLEGIDAETLPRRRFDGADTWTYLDED